MTEEERLKNQLSDDFGFFNVDLKEMNINYTHNPQKTDVVIIAKVGNIENRFQPIDFCERFFIAKSAFADRAKFENGKSDLNKQAKIFTSFKTQITQIIERIRRHCKEHKIQKEYDFDSFMRQVESAANEAKLNIEIKLLNSQIKTNESVIVTNDNVRETNDNIKKTNSNTTTTNRTTKRLLRWTTAFAILATLVSASSFIVSVLDYQREVGKDQREQQKNKLDLILQVTRSENHLLRSENDSLKQALDSLLPKPSKG